jgi:hypothetical protein
MKDCLKTFFNPGIHGPLLQVVSNGIREGRLGGQCLMLQSLTIVCRSYPSIEEPAARPCYWRWSLTMARIYYSFYRAIPELTAQSIPAGRERTGDAHLGRQALTICLIHNTIRTGVGLVNRVTRNTVDVEPQRVP